MGLAASFPMIVSYLSGHIIPRMFRAKNLYFSLAVGSCVCIFSLIVGFLLVFFDRCAERNDKQIKRNLRFLKEHEYKTLNESVDKTE
jgi:hypothetical protein